MPSRSSSGWHRLLRMHGHAFLAWVDEERVFESALCVLADDLESFLLSALIDATTANEFMEGIPDILGRCNDEVYDLPLRPEAYAYIHFLERYRRTWRVLNDLVLTGNLPLARFGVRTLDVGTGPAPVLYAVQDFYEALARFAETLQIKPLMLPAPELSAVEGSRGMANFIHQFGEWSRQGWGPKVDWHDFREFDPVARRAAALRARVSRIADEDDTSEALARTFVDQFEGGVHGLHTYRLCLFSNFLTTYELLESVQDRVTAAFDAVTPGGVVVIVGSDAVSYQQIYARVEEIAEAANFRRLKTDLTFDPVDNDCITTIIKRLYTNVWSRLDELGAAQPNLIPRANDVWDRDAAYRTTPFAVRLYRRDGANG